MDNRFDLIRFSWKSRSVYDNSLLEINARWHNLLLIGIKMATNNGQQCRTTLWMVRTNVANIGSYKIVTIDDKWAHARTPSHRDARQAVPGMHASYCRTLRSCERNSPSGGAAGAARVSLVTRLLYILRSCSHIYRIIRRDVIVFNNPVNVVSFRVI